MVRQMSSPVTADDYKILGVKPGAEEKEIARSYHRMKAIYSEGSLSTYSLLSEKEREEMLEQIEKAYMRITRDYSRQKSKEEASASGLAFSMSSADDSIGNYMRTTREGLGLTLKEISTRTKIRSTHLENIELEKYDQLPALVYLRGFILEFARALSIADPEKLAARYLKRMEESEEEEE